MQAWLRKNGLLAGSLAAWTATAVVFGFAVSVLPHGVCDYDNHDAYVEASHRALIALAALVAFSCLE
jgi:hypothetical protein